MNILITGGASGLGESVTRRLAHEKNNKIYFTYSKSAHPAEKIVSEFTNALSIKCDFRNEAELKILIDRIKEFDVDVLINNAYFGETIKSHFHKIDSEQFLTDFTENIVPTIKVTQACISHFRSKKRGKIITVLSSFLSNTPPIGSSIYVANKAYLASLVKSWATENIKFNISSNAVSPSFMQTGLTSDVDERVIEQLKTEHPLKNILTVEEVADTLFFLTNSSLHVNGVDIIMNAGVNLK